MVKFAALALAASLAAAPARADTAALTNAQIMAAFGALFALDKGYDKPVTDTADGKTVHKSEPAQYKFDGKIWSAVENDMVVLQPLAQGYERARGKLICDAFPKTCRIPDNGEMPAELFTGLDNLAQAAPEHGPGDLARISEAALMGEGHVSRALMMSLAPLLAHDAKD